jgi:hypothetical protein
VNEIEGKSRHKATCSMASDPNLPIPDLTRFLLPSNEIDAVNLLFAIPRPIRTTSKKVATTSTTSLYNAVDPYRLPYRIVHNPELPFKMVTALRSTLEKNTQPVNIRKVTRDWESYRDFEQRFVTNGSEAEIKDLSYELIRVLCTCFEAINSNQRIKHRGEIERDAQVKTDHAILTTGSPGDDDWEPVIIVEDKAMPVMNFHLEDLLSISPKTFRMTRQLNWEKAPSIVAKVRTSWIIIKCGTDRFPALNSYHGKPPQI